MKSFIVPFRIIRLDGSMNPLIPPQTNLMFQIVVLILLFASLGLKQKRNYFLHGVTMLTAVILNVVSFLLVMWPTFSGLRSFIVGDALGRLSLITVAHASFGTLAEILAIWIIASWRLRPSIQQCAKNRKMMRVTLVLWLLAIFLGILLYALLNTNLIA